jgi:Ras-related protein Rab-22
LVFDICNRATFIKLQEWVQEVLKSGPRGVVLAICGNKRDLSTDRHVSYAEGLEYAQSIHAIYIETSARDNTNVMELFMEVGKRVPVTTKSSVDGVDLNRQQEGGGPSSCPC